MDKLKEFLICELQLDDSSEFILKFKQYNTLLLEWNKKINLVSRNTVSIEDHILNSIFFLKRFSLKENSSLIDIGTGGGFPGISLKILFPELKITLLDSISKKVIVVKDIIGKLELKNVNAVCGRAEEISNQLEFKKKYDYVTAKAVAPLLKLYRWSRDLLCEDGKMIFIKGGDISEEVNELKKETHQIEIIEFSFPKQFKIEDKKVVLIG